MNLYNLWLVEPFQVPVSFNVSAVTRPESRLGRSVSPRGSVKVADPCVTGNNVCFSLSRVQKK